MYDIILENVSFGYKDDLIINNLSFKVERGNLVTIIGGNGVGKSTLMKLILGQLTVDSGNIILFGEDIEKIDNFCKVGYVPQGNIANRIAFPVTCKELVSLELYNDFGFIKIPSKKHIESSINMLRNMGLEKYINRPINELSGGLQQRVMISRAMMSSPKLLIFDEPTSGIDERSKLHFAKIIKDLNENKNITIVLVTHELEWVEKNLDPDFVYELKDGGIKNVSI